ncbi:MAG: hypothetical protein SOV27_00705 [Eubacteriales bacterium]|nr:hypothetical protein [Eubacteriales bacterium]
MSVKNDETYNENEITKAKIIVKGICLKREKLVNEVVNRDKAVDQKASSFVNAVSKEIYKQTARDYFVGKIKDCIVLCLYGDFKINKNKTKSEEDAIKLLESGKRLLEASKEENATADDKQKTVTEEDHDNYVPNFVIMDDKDKKDTEVEPKKYVPNFVIVDNNDDFTK